MLSTQCVLMNVMCPPHSIAALKHCADDDDDHSEYDDDNDYGWWQLETDPSWWSSARCVILEPWRLSRVYSMWRSGLCPWTAIATTWLRSLIDIGTDVHDTYDDNDDDDDDDDDDGEQCWLTAMLGFWWCNRQQYLETWHLMWYCTLCLSQSTYTCCCCCCCCWWWWWWWWWWCHKMPQGSVSGILKFMWLW